MNDKDSLRDILSQSLPVILFRNHPKFKELTGFAPRSIANQDSLGTGPKERIRMGRTVGYPRKAMVDWLLTKARRG